MSEPGSMKTAEGDESAAPTAESGALTGGAEAAPEAKHAPAPPPVRRQWWIRHYTFTGTAVGLLFIWFSMTPSLLPRGPLFQGLVSGFSGAIGYGIQLGPNVFPMFDRLGVSAAVLRQSDLPPALVMLDALDGTQVARIPTGESFRRRFTHPYIVVHRVDLHHVHMPADSQIMFVLDVWEHAFLPDFTPAQKSDYVKTVLENTDWTVVEKRYAAGG